MEEILVPNDAQKIELQEAPLPFFKYEKDGKTIYQFDTSMSEPPTPMVMAMVGLGFIKDPSINLVMINHKNPQGLFSKIGENYNINPIQLSDGRFQIVFSYKEGQTEKADLTQKSCH